MLHGEVEVSFAQESFTLGSGDALTFGASVPHTWSARGEEGARILWILAPGLPDPQGAVR